MVVVLGKVFDPKYRRRPTRNVRIVNEGGKKAPARGEMGLVNVIYWSRLNGNTTALLYKTQTLAIPATPSLPEDKSL
jgi:hypothetical protein